MPGGAAAPAVPQPRDGAVGLSLGQSGASIPQDPSQPRTWAWIPGWILLPEQGHCWLTAFLAAFLARSHPI